MVNRKGIPRIARTFEDLRPILKPTSEIFDVSGLTVTLAEYLRHLRIFSTFAELSNQSLAITGPFRSYRTASAVATVPTSFASGPENQFPGSSVVSRRADPLVMLAL